MQHASPPVQPQSSHEPFLCSVQLQAHTIVRIDCTVHCLTLEWMPTEEREQTNARIPPILYVGDISVNAI